MIRIFFKIIIIITFYGAGIYGGSLYSETFSDINNVVVSPGENSAQIVFDTSKLTSVIINYGLTDSYSASTVETDLSPLALSHSVLLSDLSPCTTYHYKIQARDAYLNISTNSDSVFTTTGCTASSEVSESASSQIDTTVGGSLILKYDSFNGLLLTIPAAFASSSANFQAHKLNKYQVFSSIAGPRGLEFVGDYIYELKALSDINSQISNFNHALLISITYRLEDVSELDESSLRIYRWDDGAWTQLNNCSVNRTTRTVTCETNHFSTFSIFGQRLSSASPLIITPCSSLTYDVWQEGCVNGKQFRNIISQSPNLCSLTLEQKALAERVCGESLTPENNISPLINKIESVYKEEKSSLAKIIDKNLSLRLSGYILLQVEARRRAWYLDPISLNRYYLADGPSAYQALRRFGLGITNKDLSQIPVAPSSFLPNGYNSSTIYSKNLVNRLKGKILLQVESRGEAWYVNPRDGYRYYLANGEAAYQIMKQLSLGISNKDIWKIDVGNIQ